MAQSCWEVMVALVVSVVAALSLTPSGPDLTAQAVVLLAVLAAAAAPAHHRALLTVPSGTRALLTRRRAVAVPLVLAGRTTDVEHHPQRPRAPGHV